MTYVPGLVSVSPSRVATTEVTASGGDDTETIQAAINTGVARIKFTGGTYHIVNSVLSLASDQTLMGRGTIELLNSEITGTDVSNVAIQDITITKHADTVSSGRNLLSFVADEGEVTNISVRRLAIDGNEKDNQGIYFYGVTGAEVVDCVIANVGVADTGGSGVLMQYCSDMAITGNTITNASRHGIGIQNDNTNILVDNNTVTACLMRRGLSDGQIDSYGPNNDDITITNNTVDTGTEAPAGGAKHVCVRLLGISNATVTGNHITARSPAQEYAIVIGQRDTDLAEQVTCEGNTIEVQDDVLHVFRLFGCNGVDIDDNTISIAESLTSAVSSVVYLDSIASTDVVIHDNAITGNSKLTYFVRTNIDGIGIVVVTDNVVAGAVSIFYAGNGIDVASLVVQGNEFTTAHTQAFYVYANIAVVDITNNEFTFTGTGRAIGNWPNGTTTGTIANNTETNDLGTTIDGESE